jgi:hypothetical protein
VKAVHRTGRSHAFLTKSNIKAGKCPLRIALWLTSRCTILCNTVGTWRPNSPPKSDLSQQIVVTQLQAHSWKDRAQPGLQKRNSHAKHKYCKLNGSGCCAPPMEGSLRPCVASRPTACRIVGRHLLLAPRFRIPDTQRLPFIQVILRMNLCGHLPRTSNRRHIVTSPWSFRHQGADVPSLVTLSPGLSKRTQVTSMRKLTRLLATAVANAPSSLRKYSTFLDPTTSFSSLGLGPDACQAVAVGGFTSPARIQARHPNPELREPTK